jgi:hypothetical protein
LLIPAIALEEVVMVDAVFVLATLAFFTVAWLYARGCERI